MLAELLTKKSDQPVVFHEGTYKRTATTAEAVFMITGMTIGAGILGLPYAIAKAGLIPGIIAIILLGFVVLSLNLMLGEVAARTGENMQLGGFAGRYLGPWAKRLMTLIIIVSGYGVLLAYVIGEGNVLAALFGGSPFTWSVVFWSIGSMLIWGGLERVKKVEKIFSLTVITIIAGLSIYLAPHFNINNALHINPGSFFLPFGVILFALHAAPAVGEAHALLAGDARRFKRALLFGTIIPIVLYVLFAAAVVGVSGQATTEVATIGLGETFGGGVQIFANIFAILAMATGFMGLGTALKETFVWDQKIEKSQAKFLVVAIPLLLFIAGFRSFVTILDIVGGLFLAVEAVLVVLIYWRARRALPAAGKAVFIRHSWAASLPVLVFFGCMAVVSVYGLILR